MKKYLLPLLIITTGCLNSPNEEYNDSEDLDFLEQYSLREDVQTTDSGLLYRIIEDAEGDSPDADTFSFVRYEGTSIDSTINFTTNDELDILLPEEMTNFRGLAEGVQLMSEGSVFEFVLPTNLAIRDGRVFIFEVELESYLIDPDQFLEQNVQNADITETESGLQYRVIEQAEGVTPAVDDSVRVNYTGTYTNGYVFDQSGDEPAKFLLEDVIPGFREGLGLMTVGSTFELFLPESIGYGTTPPQGILPGAVLVFEVELVEIVE